MASKSFFTEQITGLYNGVTTQPDLMRIENQAQEQINFISDVSRGLESRNGTELLKPLSNQTNVSSNSFITKIDKTTIGTGDNAITEDYVVIFTGVPYDAVDNPDGPIEIYDKNGIKQNYTNPSDTVSNYVVTANPRASIRTAVIEDYMIINNSEVPTAMTNDVSPNDDDSKLVIFIKQLQPSATYQIFLGTDKVAKVTLNNVNNPETLLNGLESDINTGGSTLDISADYTASVAHGNLVIQKIDLQGTTSSIRDDDFTVVDTYGDTLLGILNGSITKASDLPPSAPNGTIAHVVGVDEQNTLADYYLKYHSSENVWKETVAPGIPITINPDTMPHFLIKTGVDGNGVANFQFVEAGDSGLGNYNSAKEYSDRLAGDSDSNPIPSFIGKPIIDIGFFRNRLVYLGEDSIVMSRSNDYFNLFVDSAIRSLPTDPIDVFLGSNFSVRPKYMEQYQGGIIVFTENQQFIVHSSDQALSPLTVRSEFLTDFTANENVHPIRLGNNIYFSDTMGDNAVIRQYITKQGNLVRDAVEITNHVDTYIPKDVKFMFGIPNKNVLLLGVESEPKTLYVYFTFERGGKLVQSSWSKFIFNFDIYGAVAFDNDIYFIDASGDNKNISKLSLFDHSKELQIDQFVEENNENYDVTENPNNFREYTLPYLVEEDNSLICIEKAGDKINNIHKTVRSAITPGTTSTTSKVLIPTLEPYTPKDFSLSNSYISAYNGEYNLSPTSDNLDFLAYKQKDGDTKLVDYNSTTQEYEVKGLGSNPSIPDFTVDYSTPLDNNLLPTSGWQINLNVNGTQEKRDTFGNFIGNDSTSLLKGNYVELPPTDPVTTLPTSSNFDIEFTAYLDSVGAEESCVFATDEKINTNTLITLCRVSTSTDGYITINDGTTRHDFYLDGIFDNNWSDFKLNFYYGTLSFYKNNKRLTLYDRSKLTTGTRRKINSIQGLSSLTLPLTALNIMSESNSSVSCKGYMTTFKITHLTEGGGLNFDTNNNPFLGIPGNGVVVNNHELRDAFKITLRGTFDPNATVGSSSAPTGTYGGVVYCNQESDDGVLHKGVFVVRNLLERDSNGVIISKHKTQLKFIGSNNSNHTVFVPDSGIDEFVDGSHSLYFEGMHDNSEHKVEINYGYGLVQVFIDDVQVTTYSDEGLTTQSSSVSHDGGFTFDSWGTLMWTKRLSTTPVGLGPTNHYFSIGQLKYFKLDTYRSNGVLPIFETKFDDAEKSLNTRIIRDISGRGNHGYFWTHTIFDIERYLHLPGNNQFVEAPHVEINNNDIIEFTLDYKINSNEETEWIINQAGSFEVFLNPNNNQQLRFRFGRKTGSSGEATQFAYNKVAEWASNTPIMFTKKKLYIKIDLTKTTDNVIIRMNGPNGIAPQNNDALKSYDFTDVTFDAPKQRVYPFMLGTARAYASPFEGDEVLYPYDFDTLGRFNLLNVNLYDCQFKINDVLKVHYKFERGLQPDRVYDVSGNGHHGTVITALGKISKQIEEGDGLHSSLVTGSVLSPRWFLDSSGDTTSRTLNWITTATTSTVQLHYDFKESSRTGTYPQAPSDSVLSSVGSLVEDISGNNYNAKMVINDVMKYSTCWIVPPTFAYFGRGLEFGYPTESSYTLAPFFLKRNGEHLDTGRLNIKALNVSFQEAVNFALEVKVKDRDTYTKQFTQGVGQTISDIINVQKGVHKFGLNSETNNLTLTIKNDTPYRSRFVAVGYEGSFVNRSKIR